MRVIMHCIVCDQLGGGATLVAELKESGAYLAECPAGHVVAVTLANPKFDLLFQAGAFAVLAGFYSEAIADFAVALEDFNLFFVNTLCRHHGLDAAKVSKFASTVTLSERRFGAMCMAHFLFCGEVFIDDEKMRSFRNKTIHAGVIRTRDEAMKFGAYVFGIIRRLYTELQQRAPDALTEEHAAYVSEVEKRHAAHAKPGMPLVNHNIGATILNAHPMAPDTRTFEEAFKDLEASAPVLYQLFKYGNPT